MSGCIKCANCGAVSFYEGGKTKIHCITCYTTLRAENEDLVEALRDIKLFIEGKYYNVALRIIEKALKEVTK